MPGLDAAGNWVRAPKGGPVGQSKQHSHEQGLNRYSGQCQAAPKKSKQK
ncbi:Uncharacterised protein [Mycolicibacterium fortuitum]|uniref:Uncharacterized protein n=1 Tax=Mycolicibacterium fortuitum TaxID=1766 RepID=A0A378WCD2_MYCFO|nr:Uncharacterised protein [Mycolicibacterium fortuitum]